MWVKVLMLIILSVIIWHVQDNLGISKGLGKAGRLTNKITFCERVAHLVDEGRAMSVVYLDLVKPLTPFPSAFSWK